MNTDLLTLESFFESWELFADAVWAGTFAGAILGALGVYVVLRRMVFLSAALSQTAGLGVTLTFYAQIHLGLEASWASPSLGALLACLLTVAALAWKKPGQPKDRDSLLGVAFLLGSSGTILVGTRIVQELQDIQSLLFGTAVAVLPEDLTQILVACAVLGALHLWWWRAFAEVTVDPEGARIRRLPVRTLDLLLMVSLAIMISLSTRVLGAMPTFAFGVLPALTALRIAPNVPRALLLATILGAGLGFGGYVFSYMYEIPVGASQTALGVLMFILIATLHNLSRLILRNAPR